MAVSLTATVSAAPEEGLPDCFICHTRALKSHDILGSGNEACLVCHDATNMKMLRLLDNTRLSLANSPLVCGQCHQKQYDSWSAGEHGVPDWKREEPRIPGLENPKCANCHDPHQPQMEPTTITKLYPPPASEEEVPLDCLNCHVRALKGHDKLGSGSEACWACHYKTEMDLLHLAGGGTPLPFSESPRLCGQCHQKRYQDWNEGTHGVPAWKGTEPGIHSAEKPKCANCHDPHRPQVVLSNITKPHPPPAPPAPPPPVEPLMVLGVSLLLIIGIGLVVTRGGGP